MKFPFFIPICLLYELKANLFHTNSHMFKNVCGCGFLYAPKTMPVSQGIANAEFIVRHEDTEDEQGRPYLQLPWLFSRVQSTCPAKLHCLTNSAWKAELIGSAARHKCNRIECNSADFDYVTAFIAIIKWGDRAHCNVDKWTHQFVSAWKHWNGFLMRSYERLFWLHFPSSLHDCIPAQLYIIVEHVYTIRKKINSFAAKQKNVCSKHLHAMEIEHCRRTRINSANSSSNGQRPKTMTKGGSKLRQSLCNV